jgi:hypothetical protein
VAPGDPPTKHYDADVGSFRGKLRRHVDDFFTNWSTSDLPFGRKVALTVRNRAKSVVNKGCCGHHGQPGC